MAATCGTLALNASLSPQTSSYATYRPLWETGPSHIDGMRPGFDEEFCEKHERKVWGFVIPGIKLEGKDLTSLFVVGRFSRGSLSIATISLYLQNHRTPKRLIFSILIRKRSFSTVSASIHHSLVNGQSETSILAPSYTICQFVPYPLQLLPCLNPLPQLPLVEH